MPPPALPIARRCRRPALSLAALLAAAVVAAPSLAQPAPVGTWSDAFAYPGARAAGQSYGYPPGPATVRAVAADGRGGYYVGGRLSAVDGLRVEALAHWDGATWRALGGGLEASDRVGWGSPVVYDLLVARDGSLYVAGDFDRAYQPGGQAISVPGVARWADGAWEPLGGGLVPFYGTAGGRSLAEGPDGAVCVAGEFGGVMGDDGVTTPAPSVACWRGGAWDTLAGLGEYGGPDTRVRAVAARSDGALALSGQFDRGRGLYTAGVVLRAPDGSLEVLLDGVGTPDRLVWDGAALYVAGGISTWGPTGLRGVGRWAGGAWSDMDGGVDGVALDVVPDGSGGVYVAGAFRRAGAGGLEVEAAGLARWSPGAWSAEGGAVPAVDGWSPPTVYAVERWGDDLAVGGEFEGVLRSDGRAVSASSLAVRRAGEWRPLSRFDGAGAVGRRVSAASPWATVWATAPSPCGRGVLVAGALSTLGDAVAPAVALWDGRAWTPIDGTPTFYGGAFEARTIAAAGCEGGRPRFFVTGPFSEIRLADGTEVPAAGVAYWDGAAWSGLDGSLPDGNVEALAFDGETLYAAGTLPQGPSYGVYRWRAGEGWAPLGGGVGGAVHALALDGDGRLYVGGDFPTVRQASGLSLGVGGLARWSGAWEWVGNPVEGSVRALAFGPEGHLYVGGAFDAFAQPSRPTAPARNVAVWDGTAWADAGGVAAGVRALAAGADGRVYAAYAPGTYGYDLGEERLFVSEGAGWRPLGVVDGDVLSLLLDGDALYVGGSFTAAGGTPSAYLALYVDPAATPGEAAPDAVPLALSAAPNPARGASTLTVGLEAPGPVRVALYDALGREVAVVWDGPLPAGRHALPLGVVRLAPGVYVARARAGAATASRTLTVVR